VLRRDDPGAGAPVPVPRPRPPPARGLVGLDSLAVSDRGALALTEGGAEKRVEEEKARAKSFFRGIQDILR